NSKKDAHISNAINAIEAVKIYEASSEGLEDDEITIKDLKEGNYLEEKMLDPWSKKPDEYGTEHDVITKEDGEYSITFASSKCTITDQTEEKLVTEDRETLCPDDN